MRAALRCEEAYRGRRMDEGMRSHEGHHPDSSRWWWGGGRELCAVHKIGGAPLTPDQMMRWINIAVGRVSE